MKTLLCVDRKMAEAAVCEMLSIPQDRRDQVEIMFVLQDIHPEWDKDYDVAKENIEIMADPKHLVKRALDQAAMRELMSRKGPDDVLDERDFKIIRREMEQRGCCGESK